MPPRGPTNPLKHGGLRRDIIVTALAVIPGAAITVVAEAINPTFVERGWGLFLVLGLSLFAGTIATIGPRSAK